MRQHIACGYEHKLNSATCNSNQKWSNETCQGECECKHYRTCKKIIVGILALVFVRIENI